MSDFFAWFLYGLSHYWWVFGLAAGIAAAVVRLGSRDVVYDSTLIHPEDENEVIG